MKDFIFPVNHISIYIYIYNVFAEGSIFLLTFLSLAVLYPGSVCEFAQPMTRIFPRSERESMVYKKSGAWIVYT